MGWTVKRKDWAKKRKLAIFKLYLVLHRLSHFKYKLFKRCLFFIYMLIQQQYFWFCITFEQFISFICNKWLDQHLLSSKKVFCVLFIHLEITVRQHLYINKISFTSFLQAHTSNLSQIKGALYIHIYIYWSHHIEFNRIKFTYVLEA